MTFVESRVGDRVGFIVAVGVGEVKAFSVKSFAGALLDKIFKEKRYF